MMDWQTLLNQLNAEYKDLGVENPQIEVYDGTTGDRYKIVSVYNSATEGGDDKSAVCIDVVRDRS